MHGTDFLAAQSITDTIILCVPGHCMQGYSNVTRESYLISPLLNLVILFIYHHSWRNTLIVLCIAIPNSSPTRPIHIFNQPWAPSQCTHIFHQTPVFCRPRQHTFTSTWFWASTWSCDIFRSTLCRPSCFYVNIKHSQYRLYYIFKCSFICTIIGCHCNSIRCLVFKSYHSMGFYSRHTASTIAPELCPILAFEYILYDMRASMFVCWCL